MVNELRFQFARRDQTIDSLDPNCGGPCVAENQGGPTLEVLGVDELYASPVANGMGMTRAAHGVLPIPAPAVVELRCCISTARNTTRGVGCGSTPSAGSDIRASSMSSCLSVT